MIRFSIILFSFLLLLPLGFSSVFGTVNDITTNKSLYDEGDLVIISGSVSYDPALPSVTIQILNPTKSDFAGIAFALVQPDGSFTSDTIRAGGVKWSSDGTYTIKVTYDENKEKTIEYKKSNPPPQSNSEPILPHSFSTLKLQIPNFPSLDKPPQYYIDRYNNESSYKSWSDSQFPNDSIYNILGYEDPVSVPDWIRNYAEWWAIGEITDSTFVSGIEFMLENDIIMISNISSSGNISDDEIPGWIRNNAHWWSQDLISEDEFVNSLKFLIQEGIIVID